MKSKKSDIPNDVLGVELKCNYCGWTRIAMNLGDYVAHMVVSRVLRFPSFWTIKVISSLYYALDHEKTIDTPVFSTWSNFGANHCSI